MKGTLWVEEGWHKMLQTLLQSISSRINILKLTVHSKRPVIKPALLDLRHFFWVPSVCSSSFKAYIKEKKSATFRTFWKDSIAWLIVKKDWSTGRKRRTQKNKPEKSKSIHSFVGLTDPDRIGARGFFCFVLLGLGLFCFFRVGNEWREWNDFARHKDLNYTYSIIYSSASRKAPPWNIANVYIK